MPSRSQELAAMQDVDAWPNWPYQTIKQSKHTPGAPLRVAVLIDFGEPDGDAKIGFAEVNLLMLDAPQNAGKLHAARSEAPIDLNKLLDDGWVID